MARYRTVLTGVAVLVGLVGSARDVRVQTPAPFADAQVLHVGVVVPDARPRRSTLTSSVFRSQRRG